MLTNSIGFAIMDNARFFRNNFEELLENTGLSMTVGEVRALDVVTTSGDQRPGNLAAILGVEPMTMSAYLDRLNIHGLIVRLPDPADRRAKIVKVTDAAKELRNKLSDITEEMHAQLTGGINSDELRIAERVISKMRENLQKHVGTEGRSLDKFSEGINSVD